MLVVFVGLATVACDAIGGERGMIGMENQLVDGRPEIPDACTLLTPDVTMAAIGSSVGLGGRVATVGEGIECEYRGATRTLTIRTFESDPQRFHEDRALIGAEVERVSGVGDEAYFWGPQVIYVRVGLVGFSLRVDNDQGGRARTTLLDLARAASARLDP